MSRSSSWLLDQLPVGMAEHDFLRRFLHIFQDVSDTVLHQIDVLDRAFDPTVAPDAMVRQMARWIGVEWIDSSIDDETQRRIVLGYAQLLCWRGTARGLEGLLRLVSASDDVVVQDSGGVFAEGEAPRRPPHVSLAMPASSWANPDDVVTIVRSELPAGVTFDLRVGDRLVWPPEPPGGGEDRRVIQEVG